MFVKCIGSIALLMSVTVSTKALSDAQRSIFIDGLCRLESGMRPDAVGDGGRDLGILQMHRCMVDEANRVGGFSFKHRDAFDPAKARRMASAILRYYDRVIHQTVGRGATAKELAYIWNGGASSWRRATNPVDDKKQRRLESYYSKLSRQLSDLLPSVP